MSHDPMVRRRLRERRARARIGMMLFALLLTVGACSAGRAGASPAPAQGPATMSKVEPALRAQITQGLARPFLQPARTGAGAGAAASGAAATSWISLSCIAALAALHRRRRISMRRGENAA